MRRSYIAAIVALGLTATAAVTSPTYGRLVSSARSIQRSFRDLKSAGVSLSPVERFVFSLVLANSKAPERERPVAGERHT